MPDTTTPGPESFDAVVVGAGFAGLMMLHRLRSLGLRARVYEAGSNVGGTWYWNRYPGARTDSESYYYCYSFSRELLQDWTWSERYPSQPEVLRYLEHVAERFDLRRDIQFGTQVVGARHDEDTGRWTVALSGGAQVRCQYLITATGFFSSPHRPHFEGQERFRGRTYHTAAWPAGGVDFTGQRVAVIGTGATGIQVVPYIAQEAKHLTVFQRTPNYAVPAHNRPMPAEQTRQIKADYDAIWAKARSHWFAFPVDLANRTAMSVSAEERERIFEAGWQSGGFRFLFETFDDLVMSREANDTASDFIRAKIRSIVKDPAVAERLSPRDHPYCAKRPPAEHGYYETFNRPNVELVSVRETPIVTFTEVGLRTTDRTFEFDAIVYATGFDAVTGSLERMDIRGRGGQALKEKWKDGAVTYLGLGARGFPNLFMICGPSSPFANIPTCIEENVDWITGCIRELRERHIAAIEPSASAESQWVEHVRDVASQLLVQEGLKANAWFAGANIDGKARVINVYFGGADQYFKRCREVAERGYEGFELSSA